MAKRGRPSKATQVNANFEVNMKLVKMNDVQFNDDLFIPIKTKTIVDSVKKTNKAIVVSEDCKTAGVAAEISSIIVEDAFDYLDAPVIRISAPDTPIPYSRPLEEKVIPKEEDIKKAIKEIVQ